MVQRPLPSRVSDSRGGPADHNLRAPNNNENNRSALLLMTSLAPPPAVGCSTRGVRR